MFAEQITKEELNRLPIAKFEGEIVVLNDPDDAERAAQELLKYSHLGFDTETKPSFAKGQKNSVGLVQIATEHKVFLFKIKRTGIPPSLRHVLSSASIIKIGVAIADDIKALQLINFFIPNGFIELQRFSERYNIHDNSLQKLTAIVLGFKISKKQQLSNWDSEKLTEAQKDYAATDAWTALLIYKKLINSPFK